MGKRSTKNKSAYAHGYRPKKRCLRGGGDIVMVKCWLIPLDKNGVWLELCAECWYCLQNLCPKGSQVQWFDWTRKIKCGWRCFWYIQFCRCFCWEAWALYLELDQKIKKKKKFGACMKDIATHANSLIAHDNKDSDPVMRWNNWQFESINRNPINSTRSNGGLWRK